MHPLPPDPLVNSSIPIATAITRVVNWKTAFGAAAQAQGSSPLMLPQAAYIPIADIMALADKYQHLYSMKITGVRAYFGLEHPKFEGHIRLLLVPVVEMDMQPITYYRDLIVVHERMSPDATVSTSVYDFTKPCPDFCDTESILYNA
jgi:hypothetical protein